MGGRGKSIQNLLAFNAGELSPLLDARVDVDKYGKGCRTLSNFQVMKHGGVTRRPGTQYINSVKTSSAKTRLIPFNFSSDTSYVLELGNQYMRFYDPTAASPSLCQIAAPSPSAWADSTAYVAGDQVTNGGTDYVCYKGHTSEALSTVGVDDGAGDNEPGVGEDWEDFWHTTSSSSILEIPTPWETADLFQVNFAQINDVMYLTHPDHGVRKLSRYANNAWTIQEVVFAKPAFLDENIEETTITPSANTGTGVTLTASVDIFESTHVGSYWQLSHNRHPSEIKLDLPNSGNVTSDEISMVGDWELSVVNDTSSQWLGVLTLERSTDGGTTWEKLYTWEGDADRNIEFSGKQIPNRALFRLFYKPASGGGNTANAYLRPSSNRVDGLVKITAYSSATSVTADFVDDLDSYPDWVTATAYLAGELVSNNSVNYRCISAHTSAGTDEPGVGTNWATYWEVDPIKYWSEGAWSDKRGYPRAVALFEERLCFGGTSYKPSTVWGSQLDDYENFRMGTDDDDAYSFTLAAQEFNEIQWMVPTNQLVIGTSGGEWSLSSGDSTKTVSPTNVQVLRGSSYGSSTVAARQVYESVFFIQRQGRKVREQTYSFEQDARIASDVTLLSEHITSGGITQMDFQQQPDAIVWFVTGGGKLIGMTYERDAEVAGWHEHTLGGADVVVESVAVVNSSGDDEVWLTVSRTVNSATVRYVERLNPAQWTDKEDAFYVDSGITYDATATTTITGLSHLEGETVKVFADGAVQDDKTVSSGAITIDSASVVQVGLSYESKLKPMRLDADPSAGITQGQIKQIREIRARLYNALGFTSYDGNITRDKTYTSLYTGEEEVEMQTALEDDPELEISTDKPIPLTLLALVVKYQITGN